MNKKIKLLLILSLITLLLIGCGDKKLDNVVRLGVNSDEMEVWNYLKEELKKEDIELEIVTFGDYTRPNLALDQGDIDMNSFQHYAFFNKFKEQHKLDLEVIGESVIAPLGIYSNKIDDINKIEVKSKVAIPNDESNNERALNLLKSAGLIELKDTDHPTIKDISLNKYDLEFIEIEAGMIARTLEDVDIAVINSGFAVDAGLLPTEDSIYLEQINEDSKPYINIFAVRQEDKDNKMYKKVIELYQTDEVEEIINRIYKGSQKVAW